MGEEIRPGDEVKVNGKVLAVTVVGNGCVYGIAADGSWNCVVRSVARKTGRHFDEIDELFRKMGKKDE